MTRRAIRESGSALGCLCLEIRCDVANLQCHAILQNWLRPRKGITYQRSTRNSDVPTDLMSLSSRRNSAESRTSSGAVFACPFLAKLIALRGDSSFFNAGSSAGAGGVNNSTCARCARSNDRRKRARREARLWRHGNWPRGMPSGGPRNATPGMRRSCAVQPHGPALIRTSC